MAKVGAFCLLVGLAILAAGLFGALHNQISYSVGPAYFHDFKFIQFGIDPELPPRLGAAFVGVQASWWMGGILGVPLALVALHIRSVRSYLSAGSLAIGLAMTAALVTALIGLVLALALPELATQLPLPKSSDPQGFYRAALMHEGAYLGGVLGFILALGLIGVRRRRQNRKDEKDAT